MPLVPNRKRKKRSRVCAWTFLSGDDDSGMSPAASEDFVMQPRNVRHVVREDAAAVLSRVSDLIDVRGALISGFGCGQRVPTA